MWKAKARNSSTPLPPTALSPPRPPITRAAGSRTADRDIIRDLKRRGLLFHQEQYLHDYPFCWRAEEDPLIQYPRKSWFIRTTKFRDEMLANNRLIHWLPEHIRDGRFGNFLESNVDWALSRERYWGTPLPIWVCEATGYMEAVGSYEELQQKPGAAGFEVWEKAKAANPSLADHLRIHKPYIDAVTYDSPKAPGKRMRRVPDVIDCWFDSGAMPFAQWGYPHKEGIEGAISAGSSPPTSSARPSTRPAAGSTASWRSARCCSGSSRTETLALARLRQIGRASGRGEHDARSIPIRIPSAIASCWG